jgi:hypothetical protein
MRQLTPLLEVPAQRHWTERQLRRMVAEKRVPFYKVEGRILFDLNELDEYAERGRVEACG